MEDVLGTVTSEPADLKKELPEHIYEFLKSKNNLRTIQDRLVIVEKNRYRTYEHCTFTKFLGADSDPVTILKDLLSQISPSFLCFVDCHFLMIGKPAEGSDDPSFNFQSASKPSAINSIMKITKPIHYVKLLEEFDNMNHSDLLNAVYQHHVGFYEYQNSGLRPVRLLSLVVHLQKFLRKK